MIVAMFVGAQSTPVTHPLCNNSADTTSEVTEVTREPAQGC